MKRVVSAFLLVVVILGLLPIQANAIGPESSNDLKKMKLSPLYIERIHDDGGRGYWENTNIKAPDSWAGDWWGTDGDQDELRDGEVTVYYNTTEGMWSNITKPDGWGLCWQTSDLLKSNCFNTIKDLNWAQEVAESLLCGYYDLYMYYKVGPASDSLDSLVSEAESGWLLSDNYKTKERWSTFGIGAGDSVQLSSLANAILKMLSWRVTDRASEIVGEEDMLHAALLSYFWVRGLGQEGTGEGQRILRVAEQFLGKLGYTSDEKKKEEALQEAIDQLGPAPAAGATFKEKAIWSARAYNVAVQQGAEYPHAGLPVTQEQVYEASELSTLDKHVIGSLFSLQELSPPKTGVVDVESASVTPPIDALTAANSLKAYNALAAAGSLDTDYLRMEAMKYKMQATMGLASGVLSAANSDATENSVTQSDIDTFRDAAYGSAMSDVLPLLYADITDVKSSHLGNKVNAEWLYYLLVCYNEFAAYGTALINSLTEFMVDSQTTFAGYEKDLSAIKAMYEAASWVDDDAIWSVWNTGNKRAKEGLQSYSLKAIYDYLLSVNAFELIDEYDPTGVKSPLRYFFGKTEKSDASEGAPWKLSTDMRTGITASTAFLPMKTNLYDPYTFSGIVDTSWLVNFHSKFGYNRKALYIDTNVDAAVNYQRTGTRGELKVCTLEDLLYADKDIVLYLDDNLYNVNVLAEITDKAFNRLDNVDGASSTRNWWQKIGDAIVGIWDVSMENIAKTAESTTYSSKVQSGYASEGDNAEGRWHTFFLPTEGDTDGTAPYYLKPDSLWVDGKMDQNATASAYTPLTAFAVLSAIYSDSALFSDLNNVLNKNTPVFISSPTMPYVEEADKVERNAIYNYLLLKNLDSQMSIDYATNLDMTSPVYMDIYGNIVTESGLVVVPAAANATLWNSSYRPYNAAFLSTYGDDFLLEYDEDATTLNKVLEDYLQPVEGFWRLRSMKVVGGNIVLSRLSTADKDTLAAITEVFGHDLYMGNYKKTTWEMIITEVLRGAPIEHIDKDFEGLNLSHRVTKNGLVVAEKLEFLVDALSSKGTNTTLSIPNPAYMDGIEYVVFFAFKILILAILVIWMVTIYVDAVGGGVNLRTGLKCIGAVVLVLSLVVGVPVAFEVSYYQSNKLLLQNETEYLMMLNLEKRESGQEIGITSVHEPDTNTTLYLKLADIDIPWYDLLPKIITSSTANNLEALYADYEGQHPVASAEGVTVINDAVYISTDQLFDSSSISFSPTLQKIWQQSSGDTTASYYTPYYYFLENLIFKANKYSSDNEYYSYTTKVQRGGKLKTLGFVQPYFTSEQFMEEGMDYFGLYTLYDVTPPMLYTDEALMSDAEIEAARDSQWCNMNLSEKAKQQRVEKLNEYARRWVADHKELLGKVTDETFLKCFALSCAMEHNRLFNTLRADNLEIYELSNEDLMRLSIADHNTVMKDSTMSYARFVFSVGGTPAVYAAALLTLVNFVSSWVKPIATLIVFCITCISIFVFKLILRKSNNSIYGYICTILLMCSINVLGSVFLKLSMYIPSTGMSPTVCILIQILVQCAYIFALFMVIKTALKDWRNVGFERYNLGFNKLTSHHQHSVEVDTPKQKNGWDYYNALVERQRRRHRSL